MDNQRIVTIGCGEEDDLRAFLNTKKLRALEDIGCVYEQGPGGSDAHSTP